MDCEDGVWVEAKFGVSYQPDAVVEDWYLPDHYYTVKCSTPHADTELFTCYDFG
jgi:hypothetical protein